MLGGARHIGLVLGLGSCRARLEDRVGLGSRLLTQLWRCQKARERLRNGGGIDLESERLNLTRALAIRDGREGRELGVQLKGVVGRTDANGIMREERASGGDGRLDEFPLGAKSLAYSIHVGVHSTILVARRLRRKRVGWASSRCCCPVGVEVHRDSSVQVQRGVEHEEAKSR